MSGLTKKTVYADKVLATVLGVKEGEHVSYSELSKGLHKYIKDNHLRASQAGTAIPTAAPNAEESVQVEAIKTGKCRDCAGEIPLDAVFCDLCGLKQ
jgi:hypothetical protein